MAPNGNLLVEGRPDRKLDVVPGADDENDASAGGALASDLSSSFLPVDSTSRAQHWTFVEFGDGAVASYSCARLSEFNLRGDDILSAAAFALRLRRPPSSL